MVRSCSKIKFFFNMAHGTKQAMMVIIIIIIWVLRLIGLHKYSVKNIAWVSLKHCENVVAVRQITAVQNAL